MKKLSAVLVMAFGMAIAPLAIAPAAQADVCSKGESRVFSESGCDQSLFPDYAPIASQHHPYYLGETPCWTDEGITYWTPGGMSC